MHSTLVSMVTFAGTVQVAPLVRKTVPCATTFAYICSSVETSMSGHPDAADEPRQPIASAHRRRHAVRSDGAIAGVGRARLPQHGARASDRNIEIARAVVVEEGDGIAVDPSSIGVVDGPRSCRGVGARMKEACALVARADGAISADRRHRQIAGTSRPLRASRTGRALRPLRTSRAGRAGVTLGALRALCSGRAGRAGVALRALPTLRASCSGRPLNALRPRIAGQTLRSNRTRRAGGTLRALRTLRTGWT